MAQHDYNLANQSGADFRADLNNALSAIATTNSGATSPSTTFAHQLWVDTANSVLKIRNSANDAWITTGVSITADNTFDINGGTVNGITSFSFSTGSTVTSILDEDNLASDSATALATQQSIKAYVDSQVGSVDTLAEILLNGNTTGGTDIAVSTGDDITFADSSKAIFGTGGDLEIYHDGSHSYIRNTVTGNLYIRNLSDDKDIILQSDDGAGGLVNYVQVDGSNGEVRLSHYGSEKFNTTSTGVAITGNATFDDNGKAIFGTGSDLSIYHSGTGSYIDDSGDGSLYIRANNLYLQKYTGETYLSGISDSSVSLYYNGLEKLKTLTDGIDVTGTVTSDGVNTDGNLNIISGQLQLGGSTTITNNKTAYLKGVYVSDAQPTLRLTDTDATNQYTDFFMSASYALFQNRNNTANGGFIFRGSNGSANTEYMRILPSGNIGIGTSSPASLLEIDGGTGVATTGGTLIVRQNADGDGNGIAITSSNATSHRIWKSSAGVLNIGSSSNSNAFQQDLSGNVTIEGTVTSDALSVSNGTNTTSIPTTSDRVAFTGASLNYVQSAGHLFIQPTGDLTLNGSGSEIMRLKDGKVGIGTSSPSGLLSLEKGTRTLDVKLETTPASGDVGVQFRAGASDYLGLAAGGSGTGIVIDDNNNVGIGTSSPVRPIHLSTSSGGSIIHLTDDSTGHTATDGVDIQQEGTLFQILNREAGDIRFGTSGVERARIDSSGNLLVGKTGTTFSNAGIEARENGNFRAIRDGANVADFNRLTSDGNIVAFYKDGTNVGSIGTYVGYPYIGKGDTTLLFNPDGDRIIPRGTNAGQRDAAIDLGGTSDRFKDLHLSGNANLGSSNYLRFTASSSGSDASVLFGNSAGTGGSLTFKRNSDSAALVTVKADGNLLVGTTDATTPSTNAKKVVVGSTTNGDRVAYGLNVIDGATNYRTELFLDDSNATYGLKSAASAGNVAFTISQGSTEQLRVDTIGRLGIGTSSPSTGMHLSFGDSKAELTLERTGTNASSWGLKPYNGDFFIRESGTDRVTVKAGGNVGIGTTTPADELHVNGSGDTAIRVTTSSTSLEPKLVFVDGSGDYASLEKVNRDIKIKAFNTDVAYFTNDGRLGVGTSSPDSPLHVQQSTTGTHQIHIKNSHATGSGSSRVKLSNASDTNSNGFQIINNANDGVVNLLNYKQTALAFWTNATERARIDSSGNFGIGTSSPNAKLEISTTDGVESLRINSSDIQVTDGELIGEILFTSNDATLNADRKVLAGIKTFAAENFAGANANEASLQFFTANSNDLRNSAAPSPRMTINEDGKVGIGTSSPAYNLSIEQDSPTLQLKTTNTTGTNIILFSDSSSNFVGNIKYNHTDNALSFSTTSTANERMRIDSSGNIGINTTSPAKQLHVYQPSGQTGILLSRSNNITGVNLQFSVDSSKTRLLSYGDALSFWTAATGSGTNASEKVRIDSSGNLLVGTTSTANSSAGFRAYAGGNGAFTIAGTTLSLNRLSSDGEILNFQKDTSTVGSIGVDSGTIYIDGSSGSTGLYFGSSNIYPRDGGVTVDNAVDIGHGSYRFQDIYASNGTIQTSDINEKQDIEDLSEAETRVAVAAKGLLKKYRWKSAVADKGDDARIHFGIMAQDLENAFANEGLDAGDYGMFISTTWTDEATGEEKTRLGVRYNELLAFIIAAI